GYGKIIDLLANLITFYYSSKLNAFEKAVIVHYELYKIHPFLDGNKRVCRLLFNKVLLENNFPLLNISDKRGEYFDALISSVEKQNPKQLIDFTVKQYLKEVKDFLKEK
ncbi:MAG: Fic family protein, partial [archaeon]